MSTRWRAAPSARRSRCLVAVATWLAAAGAAAGCGGDGPTPPPPPSERIVFQSDRTGDWEIFAVEPDGGGPVNLTQSDGRQIHPAWSPDRRRIAFYSTLPPAGLRIMNADGTGLHPVLTTPGEDEYPAWSPDGRSIAFKSDRGGLYAIWVVNTDGSGLRRVTHLGAGESMPAWSRDGSRIAFEVVGRAIYEVNADGTGLRQLTFPPSSSWDGAPAWSPDGALLAFHRYTESPTGADAPQRIYVMRPDGTGLRQVSQFAAGQDWTPAWSPDGTRLVFAHEIGGEYDLYVVSADGTGQHRITTEGGLQFRPSW